ncbi:hypothetical protein CL654_02725 [bacterium]|nr:hypothetical protein [bacterium]|tara:strand:+ start:9386 stop:10069 length:684 start_codon:yes stop_codon:yes gene_type:complete
MIDVKNLQKSFFNDDLEQKVLKGIDLTINEGEFVSIIGPSGSGKSTLLYQLGLLDHPTGGTIMLDNINTETLSSHERTLYRLEKLGFVFQDYAILPELTALENVMLPLLMRGISRKSALEEGKRVLDAVGLSHRPNNLPGQLSGGEKQRVSVARAIGCSPTVLFADEPTANLDSVNSRDVMEVIQELNKKGQTIVLVTHEEEYAFLADRVVFLRDGMIEDIKNGKKS